MIEIPDNDRKLLTDTFGPEVAGGEEVKSIMSPLHACHAADISAAVSLLVSTHHWSDSKPSTSGWRAYQTPDHWVIAVMRA